MPPGLLPVNTISYLHVRRRALTVYITYSRAREEWRFIIQKRTSFYTNFPLIILPREERSAWRISSLRVGADGSSFTYFSFDPKTFS